jgi:hypothetical protein
LFTDNFYFSSSYLHVFIACWSFANFAGNLHAPLCPQGGSRTLVVDDYLNPTRRVAQINKSDATVITTTSHPASKSDIEAIFSAC